MVTLFLPEKLVSVQPENEGIDTPAYGSGIGLTPVRMPCDVLTPALPETPPTTPTDSADTDAEPPTVSAVGLFELSYRVQLLRATVVLPWAVMAPLAVLLSASTQPDPSPDTFLATALEPMVMVGTPTTPMKSVDIWAVAVTVTTPAEVDC